MSDLNLAAALYLVRNGVPYDRALSLDKSHLERHVRLIAMINGAEPNWQEEPGRSVPIPVPNPPRPEYIQDFTGRFVPKEAQQVPAAE